jgi:hypothetical protein
MFGARGPCLIGADEGGSGAAPPAPAPAGDPPAPIPAPAPAPVEIVFTPEQQAHINKLVGQARQEGRNAAVKQTPAPVAAQPPAPPAPPEKITIESLAAQLAETQLRARFDKRALKRGLDEDASDDLFELYKAQKPSDDEQWFSERERRLGLKQSSTSSTSQPSTPATPSVPVVPNTAPISDRGSPAPNGAVGWRFELNNPIGMSSAARAKWTQSLVWRRPARCDSKRLGIRRRR